MVVPVGPTSAIFLYGDADVTRENQSGVDLLNPMNTCCR